MTGILQKTVTNPASDYLNAIIPPINTKTEESESCFAAPEKRLFSELVMQTLCLSGKSSLTQADRKELTALFLETKATDYQATLSDRQTLSLIMSGLVKGITPMSTRKKLGAAIPGFVLLLPDGNAVEQREAGCIFWRKDKSHDRSR